MFARGLVPLHTPPLLGRKSSSVKSRVSITSKLIEIKGLQLQHFGHLRKTGGRGSYRLVHATHHPAELRPHAPVRPSQKRTSPLPAASASLCGRRPPRPGRGASALDFLFVRLSLSAACPELAERACPELAERVDCQLSASSSPRSSLALVINFSHSSLRVFRDLRTLSFSGSQLSRVLSAVCALFRKKPGVHPYVVISAKGPARRSFSGGGISFISPAYEHQLRISLVSPTYAKKGGRVVWSNRLVVPPRSSLFAYHPDSIHKSLSFRLFTSHQSPATSPLNLHWALVAGLRALFGVQSGGETRSKR
jgi:hypothetical protein